MKTISLGCLLWMATPSVALGQMASSEVAAPTPAPPGASTESAGKGTSGATNTTTAGSSQPESSASSAKSGATPAAPEPKSAAETPSRSDGDAQSTVASGAEHASPVSGTGEAGAKHAAPALAQPVSPPRPRKTRFPWRVQLEIMPVWQLSNGFDFFSGQDTSTRMGVSAAYDLIDVTPKTPLSAELGWSTESQHEEALFEGFETAFRAQNVHAGINVRHQFWPFFAPYVTLGAGASAMKVQFTDAGSSGEREYKTSKWTAFGALGAGVSAMFPVEWVLMLGASVEAGYLVSGSMPLRLDPEPVDQRLATKGASFGTLGRSGPYLRFGIFCRF